MRIFDNDELERRVDEVLYYIWDPIEMSHEPCARWEYKSYVPRVLATLNATNEAKIVSDELVAIIKEYMGELPNMDRCNKAADLLLQHKYAIQKGLA